MSSQYRKSEKPKVLSYLPTKEYGQEGDTVVVRMSGKGVFFCVKAAGIWYAQTTMQPLSKINTAYIKDLQSDKLTLKKIINAGLNTNKFLVLKDNSIKYRTGDDILDDLNVFASKKINFKTAYCSLGQYSDKESCETNGGTWYYSENDSHDSISSTPENQLLTTGQTIGTMDSESTLLYDGSTLEIKYNSDYDDNWQTLAQTDLLKLSYSSKSAIINLDSDGDLILDVDGDIEFNADGGDVTFKDDTADLATINGTGLTINNIGADSAGDNYLVEVSGLVKKRTPAEVRSDIGAGTSSVGALNDLSDVTYSGGDLTISSLDTIISGALLIDSSGDITLDPAGADIHIDKDGTNFGSINTTTAQKLKILGASNYQVELVTSGTGNIVLTSADDITIDSADKLTIDTDGNFAMKKDSVEYSVANSAYAGMILGYRMIGEDAGHSSYTLTTSYVVPDSAMTVRFVAPPSGNVEVMVQVLLDGNSNRTVTFGLSDNATYNSIGNSYQQITGMVDESDKYAHQHYWTVTGLTAGDTYNYWLGASANGGYLSWGGTGSDRFCDFIMKVTALPTATSDFAEYD